MIRRCNDFGAGGVSVAIGELADGLDIDLNAVPKKYDGLDGTELAISESQERMAVVVAPENAAKFVELAAEENIEATIVAKVTVHQPSAHDLERKHHRRCFSRLPEHQRRIQARRRTYSGSSESGHHLPDRGRYPAREDPQSGIPAQHLSGARSDRALRRLDRCKLGIHAGTAARIS